MTEPKITPLARRLAEENGIDWHNLEGTGPDGTIVERDILAFLAKVMAGEVELPPEPTEAAPPEAVPDISQVQEVLAREGVDIGDLVPETPVEPPAPVEAAPTAEEVFVEEETFFEVDFEEVVAETPAPENESTGATGLDEEGWTVVEPDAEAASPWLEPEPEEAAPSEEALGWEEPVEAAAEEPAFEWEAPEPEPEPGAEPAGEVAAAPERPAEPEASGGVDLGEPTPEEAAAPEEPVEAQGETGPLENEAAEAAWPMEPEETFAETPEPEPPAAEPEPAASELEAAEAEPAPAEAEPEPPAAPPPPTEPASEEPAFAAPEGEEAAPAAAVAFPPAFRRAVDLGAAERARADLSAAWRREVPLELLLFRAADRALAELEVPLRPVLGRLEGETARTLAVPPALGLRDLFDQMLAAEEGGEGLVVLDLSETPYAEVILPGQVLLALGRAGLPQDLGLLSISGELPTDRTRFLERVAFYLERPILLA
ncbi:E3 binding domain-containing protein [Deinococcota bacterium DY0809b]